MTYMIGRSCWEGGGPGLGVLLDGHRLQGCAVRFLGESAGQEQRRRASGAPWNPAEVRSQTARISDGVKKNPDPNVGHGCVRPDMTRSELENAVVSGNGGN